MSYSEQLRNFFANRRLFDASRSEPAAERFSSFRALLQLFSRKVTPVKVCDRGLLT